MLISHPSLVIGAPYYRYKLGKDTDSSRTIGGAIYVLYNYGDGINETGKVIITAGMCKSAMAVGECNDAQFGYAISSLGDINGDGYAGM